MRSRGSIGVDAIEIARIERALERRPGLARRLFTDAERDAARSRRRPATHLAARFAAKEAAAKALELRAWSPLDVEVVGGGSEPPSLALRGGVARVVDERGLVLDVSLSHTREQAVATVLALPAAG